MELGRLGFILAFLCSFLVAVRVAISSIEESQNLEKFLSTFSKVAHRRDWPNPGVELSNTADNCAYTLFTLVWWSNTLALIFE